VENSSKKTFAENLEIGLLCSGDWNGFSYRGEYLRSVGLFKEAVPAILAAIAKQERIMVSKRV
jgi:hypothetical protein